MAAPENAPGKRNIPPTDKDTERYTAIADKALDAPEVRVAVATLAGEKVANAGKTLTNAEGFVRSDDIVVLSRDEKRATLEGGEKYADLGEKRSPYLPGEEATLAKDQDIARARELGEKREQLLKEAPGLLGALQGKELKVAAKAAPDALPLLGPWKGKEFTVKITSGSLNLRDANGAIVNTLAQGTTVNAAEGKPSIRDGQWFIPVRTEGNQAGYVAYSYLQLKGSSVKQNPPSQEIATRTE